MIIGDIPEIAFPPGEYNADISSMYIQVYTHFSLSPLGCTLPPSILSWFLSFGVLARCSREIDIIFNVVARVGMSSEKERVRQGGGPGVLQCEIPSITPWASYIRDYFSFLSPRSPFHPLAASLLRHFFLLRVYLSSLPHLSLSEATSTCQQVSESISRGERKGTSLAEGNVQKSWLLALFPFLSLPPPPPPARFLRNYGKLVPWWARFVICLILSRGRYARERDGKRERGERKIDVGAPGEGQYKRQTSSRLVRECFNLGRPWREEKSIFFLMKGQKGGG